jgi:hypothetical protein
MTLHTDINGVESPVGRRFETSGFLGCSPQSHTRNVYNMLGRKYILDLIPKLERLN